MRSSSGMISDQISMSVYYSYINWIIELFRVNDYELRALFLTLYNIHRCSELIDTLPYNRLQYLMLVNFALVMSVLNGNDLSPYSMTRLLRGSEESSMAEMTLRVIDALDGTITVPTEWDSALGLGGLEMGLRRLVRWNYLCYGIDPSTDRSKNLLCKRFLEQWDLQSGTRRDAATLQDRANNRDNPLFLEGDPISLHRDTPETIVERLRDDDYRFDIDNSLGAIWAIRDRMANDIVLANSILQHLSDDPEQDLTHQYDVIFGADRLKLCVGRNIKRLSGPVQLNAYTCSLESLRRELDFIDEQAL